MASNYVRLLTLEQQLDELSLCFISNWAKTASELESNIGFLESVKRTGLPRPVSVRVCEVPSKVNLLLCRGINHYGPLWKQRQQLEAMQPFWPDQNPPVFGRGGQPFDLLSTSLSFYAACIAACLSSCRTGSSNCSAANSSAKQPAKLLSRSSACCAAHLCVKQLVISE